MHKIICVSNLVSVGNKTSVEEAQISPRKLRERQVKGKTLSQLEADSFERDFDSPNASEDIQFKQSWDCRPWEKQKRRLSRRLQLLPPSPAPFTTSASCNHKTIKPDPEESPLQSQELILDNNVRVYRSPKIGWSSLTRRVVQHGAFSTDEHVI